MGLQMIGLPKMGRALGILVIGDDGNCGRWASLTMGVAVDRADDNRAMENGSADNGAVHDVY